MKNTVYSTKLTYKIITVANFIGLIFCLTKANNTYASMDVYCVDETIRIDRDNQKVIDGNLTFGPNYANYLWDPVTRTVTIYGARNEVVGFQIIVYANSQALNSVNVTTSSLKGDSGTIPASNISIFREWYTQVSSPSTWPKPTMGAGWYPDALIPASVPNYGLPINVASGKSQGIWVDVYIPKIAGKGDYTGTFTVSSDAGSVNINVKLHVWDFDLPDAYAPGEVGQTRLFEFFIFWDTISNRWGGMSMTSAQFRTLENKFYQMARDHKFQMTTFFWWQPASPTFPQYSGSGSSTTVDWTYFDERFSRYLDGTGFKDGYPVPVWLTTIPRSGQYSHGTLDLDTAQITKISQLYRQHFDAKGWKQTIINYLIDEPHDAEGYTGEQWTTAMRNYANATHSANANVYYRCDFCCDKDWANPLINIGYVDLWAWNGATIKSIPTGQTQTIQVLATPREGLKNSYNLTEHIMFYQESEPYLGCETIDGRIYGFRVWAWILWKYKMYGYNMWQCAAWTTDPWNNPLNNGTNAQAYIFYPGNYIGIDEPVASIRMKMVRRGISDYQYMDLITRYSGNSSKADFWCNSVVQNALAYTTKSWGQAGEWSINAIDWFNARKGMGENLEAIAPSSATSSETKIVIYPNPARIPKGSGKTVKFANLLLNSNVEIYNIVGEKVKSLRNESGVILEWDLKNENGEEIAGGTYYVICGSKKGKFSVIR